MRYVFGIDVGGTTTKIGLFQDDKLIKKYQIRSNTEEKGKYVLGDITNKIKEVLKEEKISLKDIEGFGFGVPGPVVKNKVIRCANLGWENIQLDKEFKRLIGEDVYVKVGNDATIAAVGEYNKMGLDKSIVFITLGTGVGGGVISNGIWFEGATGANGEIGHINIDKNGPLCSCGKRGCLETYAGIRGWNRFAKELIEEGKLTTKLDINNLDPRFIHTLAKKGDEVGIEVVKRVADVLGYACANIAAIVNPDVFIIGGGISNAGWILIDNLQESFNKYAFYGVKGTTFELAKLGNDAGMYGCYYMIKK
ncbi:MAG: ROK family protein [Acholeplasmataceae bacterium]|jgi:glucokinase|nr:ROK family protein [Acholeplasmataceae bacterium]